jgi:multimeric flavodoxin WrbA
MACRNLYPERCDVMPAKNAGRRALGIVGSPRRGGNTEVLVDEVLAGAQEAGASIDKVILSELRISPCKACDSCRKTGVCVQKDDMHQVLALMEQSQVWVLGTPVYWWGPSAQFKAFLDRWYGAKRAVFRARRVVLVVPLGGESGEIARHTVGMLEDVFDYLGLNHVATILSPGVERVGEVRKHTKVMAEARQAGSRAVEEK